ncbi:MAG: hypothetical protein QOF01_1222, partial [Thermomicrobiales bacterium]|nr:hypothetical protein [Thermomicrobiales bacterium]
SGDCKKDVCDGAGGIVQINDDSDVPADDGNPCTANTCGNGVPYPPLPAGTECNPFPARVCDGTGSCVPPKFNGQPCLVNGQCSSGSCADGVCCDSPCDLLCRACTAARKGTGLDGICGPIQAGIDPDGDCPGASACDGNGGCTGCTGATECPGQDDECKQRTCVNGNCGFSYTSAGTPMLAQTPGDCKKNVCDGSGQIVQINDDTDVPANDGNQCTAEVCNQGTPARISSALGTPCNQGGGTVCNGSGACVACAVAADCPGQDTECQTRTCIGGACGFANTSAGTPLVAQTGGDCKQDVCDGAGGTAYVVDDTDVPGDDGNQCTENTCIGGVPYPPKPLGTDCNQFPSVICNGAGACVRQALNGTECIADVQCLSGSCVDGYCCNALCTATCFACNLPDNLGRCLPVTGASCNENGGTICNSDGRCVPA